MEFTAHMPLVVIGLAIFLVLWAAFKFYRSAYDLGYARGKLDGFRERGKLENPNG